MQLIKPTTNTLEVVWTGVPTADAYLLQIQKVEANVKKIMTHKPETLNEFLNKESPPVSVFNEKPNFLKLEQLADSMAQKAVANINNQEANSIKKQPSEHTDALEQPNSQTG